MALIVCPECGKKFSDKAPACPECGCPTLIITESITTNQNSTATANMLNTDQKPLSSQPANNPTVESKPTVNKNLTDSQKLELYEHAINCAKEGTINAFEFSISKLKELGDYKDSISKITEYEKQIENLNTEKKNTKQAIIAIIIFAIILIIVIFSIKGCSSGGSNDSDYGEQITSSSQAINAVKNYNSGTPFSTEQLIAHELGFNNFYSPQYGTSEAYQNDDGSWEVEINGNMSGYVDDYADDFENYKFTIKATVSSDGSPSISVYKEY